MLSRNQYHILTYVGLYVKPEIFMTFSFHDFHELEKFMKLKNQKNFTFFHI